MPDEYINEAQDDLYDDAPSEDDEIKETTDQTAQEVKELRQQLKDRDDKVGKLLEQQQQLLSQLNKQPEPQQQETEVRLPDRPNDYDETLAYTDPTSSSFRYRIEYEDAKRRYEQEQMLAMVNNAIEEKVKMNDQVNKVQQMETELVKNRKLKNEDISEFRNWLSTQKSLTMEEMHDVYLRRAGKKLPEPKDTSSKPNESKIPDINSFSGGVEPTPDENEAFEADLMSGIKDQISKYKS